MPILATVEKLVVWLVEAAVAYNKTDVGSAGLVEIENELEAEGIDVPFFEPTDQQGQPLDLGAIAVASGVVNADQVARFKAKHPEIFKDVQS